MSADSAAAPGVGGGGGGDSGSDRSAEYQAADDTPF